MSAFKIHFDKNFTNGSVEHDVVSAVDNTTARQFLELVYYTKIGEDFTVSNIKVNRILYCKYCGKEVEKSAKDNVHVLGVICSDECYSKIVNTIVN